MKHVAAFLAVAILCLFGLTLSAAPAVAQAELLVTPGQMPTVEVPGNGAGQTGQFTLLVPDVSCDIEIGLENIPLDYQPKTVSVQAGVAKKVVLTFYGDESIGYSAVYKGKITFLPRSEALFIPGVKVPTQVIHRVTGAPILSYSLAVSIDPPGSGSVTLDPPVGPYAPGTVVTLTAAPVAGYAFDHWSGDASGTNATTTVTMDSHKAVTAHFRQITCSLNVSIEPEGSGSVTLDPAEGPYPWGTQVTLTAEPASGYAFDHWSGDASGTNATVTITMDSDKSVTAHFTAPAAAAKAVMVRWVYVLIGLAGGVAVILAALWLLRRRRRHPA